MEEKPVEESSQATPAPQKKSVLNIWRVLAIVLFVILLVGAGYLIGTKLNSNVSTPNPTPQISTSPTQTNQSPTVTSSVTTAPTKIVTNTISAGVKTDAFVPYTIEIPSGWTNKHTYESTVDKLVVAKGPYSLTIIEGGGGGGLCTYPGEAPQQMSQSFTGFVGITGTQSQLRRGTSDNINYTVCEQKTSGFGFPTQFGYITYITPSSPDASVLAEMDRMVASITK